MPGLQKINDPKFWTLLFQPDILAPHQFSERMRPRQDLIPERRLMLAILDDAVVCFQRSIFHSTPGGQKRFHETVHWFFDEEEKPWLYSFESICDGLGLNPNYIRAGLTRWRLKRSR